MNQSLIGPHLYLNVISQHVLSALYNILIDIAVFRVHCFPKSLLHEGAVDWCTLFLKNTSTGSWCYYVTIFNL